MRGIHRTLTISGLISAGLFVFLCVLLFRRWVFRPVRSLREAALRIGKGEFAHRVPVVSRDELGLLSGEGNRMAELVASMQSEAVGCHRDPDELGNDLSARHHDGPRRLEPQRHRRFRGCHLDADSLGRRLSVICARGSIPPAASSPFGGTQPSGCAASLIE
jgi:HAMP domain-containing protein